MRVVPLLGVLAVGITQVVRAQSVSPIRTGEWIVDGAANFSHVHGQEPGTSGTSVSLAPSALRFVTPHLALGTSLALSHSSSSSGHSNSVGIGPAVRYFFGDSASTLQPFVAGSVTLNRVSLLSTINLGDTQLTTDATQRALGYDGSIGLTKIIATNVGITGEAYYAHLHLHMTPANDETRDSYSAGARFGFTVFVR